MIPGVVTRPGWVCTQDAAIDHFAWFCTTGSKSRGELPGTALRAGHGDYVINCRSGLPYMLPPFTSAVPAIRLAGRSGRQAALPIRQPWAGASGPGLASAAVNAFAPDHAGCHRGRGFWGSPVKAHGPALDTVYRQRLGMPAQYQCSGPAALCGVHAERLVHKLHTFTAPSAPPRPSSKQPLADLARTTTPSGVLPGIPTLNAGLSCEPGFRDREFPALSHRLLSLSRQACWRRDLTYRLPTSTRTC